MSVSFNCGSASAFMRQTRTCRERMKRPVERNWEVLQRECNHSAFNGYHWTASDYSTVRCKTCNAVGRTKANYVALLRDA